MSRKKILFFPAVLGILFIIITGCRTPGALAKVKTALIKEANVTWQDKQFELVESQAVEFKEDTMVVTSKSVFKNGEQVVVVARIPVGKLHPARLDSFPHLEVKGMYYLNVFTKNNEKTIEVTTSYGKNRQPVTVYTHFFTLYSKHLVQGSALKEKIERLIRLLGG